MATKKTASSKAPRVKAATAANPVQPPKAPAAGTASPAARPQVPFRRPQSLNFAGVGRNDICPCGSGKRFKNCHGH
jgi:preprotein translocase subunit SecA